MIPNLVECAHWFQRTRCIGTGRAALGALTAAALVPAALASCGFNAAEHEGAPCGVQASAPARPSWQVGALWPASFDEVGLERTNALGDALVCSLLPGDSLVATREDSGATVFSAVVPGSLEALRKAADCGDTPIGGPSSDCMAAASAAAEFDAWRSGASRTIHAVGSDTTHSRSECTTRSGWPRELVLQLLLAVQPEPGDHSVAIVLLFGDADRRGEREPIPERFIANVHVVVSYRLVCGEPRNVFDWFEGAASISLFPIDRPAEMLGPFLLNRFGGGELERPDSDVPSQAASR